MILIINTLLLTLIVTSLIIGVAAVDGPPHIVVEYVSDMRPLDLEGGDVGAEERRMRGVDVDGDGDGRGMRVGRRGLGVYCCYFGGWGRGLGGGDLELGVGMRG